MSVNKVILKGRLGGDPEINGTATKLSLATSYSYKKESGEKVENTAWHKCVAFGRLGEVISKHFKKGDEIYIEGRIDYHEHEGKYYTNIIISEFDFCGPKQDAPF